MTTVAPEDRPFPSFPRGKIRDEALEALRVFLRQAIDPATGLPFEETDIQAATRDRSRYWSEADQLDLVMLGVQQRAIFLADQAHPLTATAEWLRSYHGSLWPVGAPLQASPGAGVIFWPASPGTVFVGSTTVIDPVANTVKIGTFTYQVLYTEITPASGICELTVQCLDTGYDTNAAPGATIVGSFIPGGASVEGITIEQTFSGGAPAESAAQYAIRIMDEIRYRAAAGNNAQVRSWARRASNAVEDAFVYACALQAGSCIVCVMQRRGNAVGPLARLAGAALLANATAALVPPGSPFLPSTPFVVPCTPTSTPVNTMVRLTMAKGSPVGWTDAVPWPACTTAAAAITTVTSQVSIRITLQAGLPAPGVALPRLMIWNKARSEFELLAVSAVALFATNVYTVTLSVAPSFTMVVGDYVSPAAGVMTDIAEGAQAYHDSLGPGEVVDLLTSHVAHRAYRFPPPDEAWTATAGSSITTFMREALAGSSTNELLVSQSVTSPPVPTSPVSGPALLTLGHLGVYPA